MEAPEVKAGAYCVFDAEGSEAEISLDRWNVKITGWAPPSPERMRDPLTTFLSRHGFNDAPRMSLPELVATVDRAAREFEESRTHPRWLMRLLRRRRKQRASRRA
jgi:hypothetical protein